MAKAKDIEGLHAHLPYAEAAALTCAPAAEELFAISSADVLDTADIERVHDMRVASRRLRAGARDLRPCFERDASGPSGRRQGARRRPRRPPRPDVSSRPGRLRAAMPPRTIRASPCSPRTSEASRPAATRVCRRLEPAESSDLRGRLVELADSAVARPEEAR
jgi:hypothetical protein